MSPHLTDQSLSETIESIMQRIRETGAIRVEECMELLSARSILIVILVFALPNSLPVPAIPGVSTITGIPILFVAVQLLFGREDVWLPRKVENYKFHEGKLAHALQRLLPYVKKIENWLRPRIYWLSAPIAIQLSSIVFFLMAVLMALPLPAVNFPPGFTMTMLAMGLLTRDGIMILFGYFCACLTLGIFLAIFGGALISVLY